MRAALLTAHALYSAVHMSRIENAVYGVNELRSGHDLCDVCDTLRRGHGVYCGQLPSQLQHAPPRCRPPDTSPQGAQRPSHQSTVASLTRFVPVARLHEHTRGRGRQCCCCCCCCAPNASCSCRQRRPVSEARRRGRLRAGVAGRGPRGAGQLQPGVLRVQRDVL